ncbi:MAG: transglutaminase family protein, partial [Cyanobium sp.]
GSAAMEAVAREVAREVDRRLAAASVHLTLGGEPTYVPFEPSGAEWTIAADGPTKLPLARAMAAAIEASVWPGSTLLYCPGKRYEGEVNPRWALRLITGADGTPPVRWPDPQGSEAAGSGEAALAPEQGLAWLERLARRLGADLQPLALVDPLASERRVWAIPLSCEEEEAEGEETALRWLPAAWPLEPERRRLSGAPGPAGLRLPLEHFPEALPRQVLTLDTDGTRWELFLPPLTRRPLTALLQAIADSLDDLAAPRLSGVLPVDADGHWQVLGLTADPGVLEVNLPVCRGWEEYRNWLQQLERCGERVGLRSWKPGPDGQPAGTGGGNHLLWGGPSLAEHPFFPRPAWLAGILRYLQHHPALAYLFSSDGVGPASQAPRPDEAAGEIFDLELAYSVLERVESRSEAGSDHRWLIGETLRHLHADRSGNNHRSEISVDKFWNPGTPAGCLGLVEFRALESLPRVEWSAAVALLWSALAAHQLEPAHRPGRLRDWGEALHDRMLLPSALWADLEELLAMLAADGMALDPEPFRQLWEWRFPPLLQWQRGEATLELRPALEPWPLICDFPREGGFTSRFVDGSLRRFEVIANGAFRADWRLALNGRELPLPGEGEPLAVRYRLQRLYPCLHPAIAPHWPLQLDLQGPEGAEVYVLNGEGTRFEAAPGSSSEPHTGLAWSGRRRPGEVTIDLRLEEGTPLIAAKGMDQTP